MTVLLSGARGRMLRRASVLLVAAGLTVVAAPTAAPASATVTAKYVGIVVAGHGSSCVRWHAGITGDDVLNAVASVRYRNDGLIVQIDGAPSSGKADSTHYWSYWHDTSASWQYSSSGASGYRPGAGTVEGWSFVNGSSKASPPGSGPGGLYAGLCGSRDAPAPRPLHHVSSPRPKPRSAGASTARVGTDAGRERPAGSSLPATSTSTSAAAPSSSAGSVSSARSSATPSPSTADTASSGPATGAAGPSFADASTVASAKPSANGSPWPVVLGVALVLLLGAGGGWGVLRRRRADAAEH